MSHLDGRQRSALAQLLNIVHDADEQVAINVLDSVDWDVQRAVDLIFQDRPPMQPFTIDDRPRRRPPSVLQLITRPLFAVFAVPIHILSNIVRFIFNLLRIPLPQLRFSSLSFYTPRSRRSFGGPDRWVRELEEETGAVCISTGTSTAVDAGSAGPSNLRSRIPEDTKVLPDFTLGSYEEVLRTCQREARIGCIVLVSEEHDDVPEFKRSTLTNPEFVRLLHDNNVVVWGGDVRDHEAYSAAEKLQATTYPFVAFIALQPRRSPSSSRTSSNASPTLTVLSRHQGSPTGPTSAATLSAHLTTQLLPRITPFLARIHATNAERERERVLREEQDKAFNETAARDRERIEKKMAEEQREIERKREAKLEAEMQRLLKVKEEERKEVRMGWRRWVRRALAASEMTSSGGVRIAVRLPSGGRTIKAFSETETLTALYAFVDAALVPAAFSKDEDPTTSPAGDSWNDPVEECLEKEAQGLGEWWGFRLVLAYPRKEIPWVLGMKIGDVEALQGGGQLVVEMLEREEDSDSEEE